VLPVTKGFVSADSTAADTSDSAPTRPAGLLAAVSAKNASLSPPRSSELDGERLHEERHGAVGRGGDDQSRSRTPGREAGEQQDRTAGADAGCEVLGEQQGADHLGVERPPHGVGVELTEGAVGVGGGHGDEVVELADLLGQRRDRSLVAQVHPGGDRGAGSGGADPCHHRAQPFGVATRQDDVRTRGDGVGRDARGDPGPAPDDDDLRPAQVRHRSSFLVSGLTPR
jgi:hypothetical protein